MRCPLRSALLLSIVLCPPLQAAVPIAPNGAQQQQIQAARMLSSAFTFAAKQATPAVVFIKAQKSATPSPFNPFEQFADELFHFFEAPSRPPQKAPPVARGSGFLISSTGHIITNAHVVKGAEKIIVALHDRRELKAQIVGIDTATDIAVLKIAGQGFPHLHFADSEKIDIGEWVVAIGNPLELQASVTVGIVSAKGRQNLHITDLEDFIQTDAAINPGNSGGPLLNLEGRVVGINTAICIHSVAGYGGIGFAIPSNLVKHTSDQIISTGNVARGFLGIKAQEIDHNIAKALRLDKPKGVLVVEVFSGSPAEKAGLKQRDLILAIDGQTIKSPASLYKKISLTAPGTCVQLTIQRQGKALTFPISLGSSTLGTTTIAKLGIEVKNLTSDLCKQLKLKPEGVLITKVKSGSPAEAAGLMPGMVILSIQQKEVSTVESLHRALADLQGQKQVLLLIRDLKGNVIRFYPLDFE